MASAPDLEGFDPGIRTIWQAAHASNFTAAGSPWYDQVNEPVALVFHTPEEPWDDNESTPNWFANPASNASTHYYSDSDGDLYQMVRDRDCAWAQGTASWNRVLPRPAWYKTSKRSENCQALSIEVEGFARSIGRTFLVGGPQFNSVVAWAAFKAKQYSIPVDRAHFNAHSEIATNKSDPGQDWPWDAFLAAVKRRIAADANFTDPGTLDDRVSDLETWRDFHTVDPNAHS